MSDVKVCKKCGVAKALTEFSKGKAVCKPCRAKKGRDFRDSNVSTYINPTYKKCGSCDEVKTYSEFRRKSDTRDGYQPYCKECANRISRDKRPQYADRQSAYNKQWARSNRDKRTFTASKRRAAKLQRTAAWADTDAIKSIYAEARRLQKVLGIPMHVDHVLPLQGELVCGLHVESNLQVIPAILNLKKSNKFKVQ